MTDTALMPTAPESFVPASYAEKAMASLLQLHSELMEEKERRVDLYRRLMEKEQSIAELKMYVKLLEEKLAKSELLAMKPAEPIAKNIEPIAKAAETVRAAPAAVTRENVAPMQAAPMNVTRERTAPMNVAPPRTAQPLPRVQAAPIPGPAFPRTQPHTGNDGWKAW